MGDFLQKWKVECWADGLVPIRVAIFSLHLSKVLRLRWKSDAKSYGVLHLSRKIISANPKIWGSKPLVFLTSWLRNVLRATTAWTCSTSQLLKVLRSWSVCTFLLRNVLRATTAYTFSTSQLPKVARTWCALYILTSKCASRHNGVHFFDIATSKRGPNMVCFVHVDFEMCFTPQQRALFRHLNFQKCSEPGVFCTFWLANVLCSTTACNFSSLICPAGFAPAALASLLFDPLEPQIIGKTQSFGAPGSSFFWDFLFSDLLSSALLSSALLFSILLLHLCFSSVHIVGSLTSKLPSITGALDCCRNPDKKHRKAISYPNGYITFLPF